MLIFNVVQKFESVLNRSRMIAKRC